MAGHYVQKVPMGLGFRILYYILEYYNLILYIYILEYYNLILFEGVCLTTVILTPGACGREGLGGT